jgi:hypothetical protein
MKKYISALSRHPVFIGAPLFIAVLALAVGTFFMRANASSIGVIAQKIVADCSKIEGDHSACYESEVPSLYPKLSVPSIFDVVRKIRDLDPSYQFCHVLGHKIGERVVAEDPSKWVDAIPLNPPDGLCSNGFIHGVIAGRFSADVLNDATIQTFMPQFSIACEPHALWQPSGLDQAMCYHAMGHLFDFITNANLTKAVSLCDTIGHSPTGDFTRVCHEGVFMQIFQPLEPDDYQLIAQMPLKPTKNNVRQFCASYKTSSSVGACLRESWALFGPKIFDNGGVAAFCSGQPNADETEACFESASAIVGRTSLGDPQKAATTCNSFPSSEQLTCYSFVSEAVLEEDRTQGEDAIALCKRAPSAIADACIQNLAQKAKFNFQIQSGELQQFCSALPTQYQQECDVSSDNSS